MTREEAIKFAECLKNNWTINFDDLEPFCDMAIEALKSKSEITSTWPQSTNDCISRQDDFEKQIYAMFDHIWDCEIDHPIFQDTVGDLMTAVIQCYKCLPPTQLERKKGVWIDDRCSICGYGVEPWNNTPYCPNCGADMRGDRNDNNY